MPSLENPPCSAFGLSSSKNPSPKPQTRGAAWTSIQDHIIIISDSNEPKSAPLAGFTDNVKDTGNREAQKKQGDVWDPTVSPKPFLPATRTCPEARSAHASEHSFPRGGEVWLTKHPIYPQLIWYYFRDLTYCRRSLNRDTPLRTLHR